MYYNSSLLELILELIVLFTTIILVWLFFLVL